VFFLVLAILVVILFSSRAALSYYVDVLWFDSCGDRDIFRKTISLQWAVFAAFFAVTFLVVYGWFLVLRRARQPDLPDDHLMIIGGQPLRLPAAHNRWRRGSDLRQVHEFLSIHTARSSITVWLLALAGFACVIAAFLILLTGTA
jgi:hypothetical protein